MHRVPQKKGFTLIEFLLYIALSSLMIIVLGGIGMHVLASRAKAHAQVELQYSAEFAMEELASLVAASELINDPAVGNEGESLTLSFAETALDPTIVYVENSRLYVQQGASDPVPLIDGSVFVAAHTFTNVTRTDGAGAVRLFLQLETSGEGDRNAEFGSSTFYTTFSIE